MESTRLMGKGMENENRIIADFYGKSQQFNNLMGGKTTLYSTPTHPNSCHAELHELEYHTSWDWLMPVVEKIENAEVIGQRVYVTISPYEISIYCSGILERGLNTFSVKEDGRKFTDEMKKKVVVEMIVQFINWYNSQPPQV